MKLPPTTKLIAELQDIASTQQEHMVCFTLDSKQRVIDRHLVFKGTVSGMVVHPREVFKVALTDSATSIIIAHNHPSGDVKPSQEDIRTTQQFEAAGRILGVRLYDHLIVGGKRHYSFRKHDLIYRGTYAEPVVEAVGL